MYEVPQSLEAAEAHIGALRHLVESGGWKLYEAYLESEESRFIAAIAATKDAHQLTLLAGTIKALRDLRTWPARQAALLRGQINAAEFVNQ